MALKSAGAVIKANPQAAKNIRLRQQQDPNKILKGAIKSGEHYAATMCNPPFHRSAEDALSGTRRKLTNLGRDASAPVLNFGGKAGELWCEGGEVAFITKMIEESESFAKQVGWFTSLVSRQENLPAIYEALEEVEALTKVGAQTVGLGPRILRTETAAMTAALLHGRSCQRTSVKSANLHGIFNASPNGEAFLPIIFQRYLCRSAVVTKPVVPVPHS